MEIKRIYSININTDVGQITVIPEDNFPYDICFHEETEHFSNFLPIITQKTFEIKGHFKNIIIAK